MSDTFRRRHFLFTLVAGGTILGIAGTDLVLPAVPSLPLQLGGSVQTAQLVLAAYAFGTLIGLLAYGELGARFNSCTLLIWSLALFGLVSLASAASPSIEWLVIIRFAQGAFGSAAAVFAPGFIHGLYPQERVPAVLGRLGSVESLAPALAPIIGAYLLEIGGWRLSFILLSALALLLGLTTFSQRTHFPPRAHILEKHAGYIAILKNPRFASYAASQALSLGAILVFVFGAPAVLTGPLGKDIGQFVVLQVVGIAAFIVAANFSTRLALKFGTLRVIKAGTAIMPLAFMAMLGYSLAGGANLSVLVPLWVAVCIGFGLRGPIGFHRALGEAQGDHSRAAALVLASILGVAALGTTAVAPYVIVGLWPLAIAGLTISTCAFLSLLPVRDCVSNR